MVIVCEGEKTEPNYFHGFRKEHRLQKELFDVVSGKDGHGNDPANLVKFAKEKKKKLDKDAKEYGFKDHQVWCVFDRDRHPDIDQAINQAYDNKINIAFSNPCFELWLLIHFHEQTSHIEREDAERKLGDYIPDYEKGMKDIYDKTNQDQMTAVKRAEDLRKMHDDKNDPNLVLQDCNPVTTVDKLIGELMRVYRDRKAMSLSDTCG